MLAPCTCEHATVWVATESGLICTDAAAPLYILSFELADDPSNEREVLVDSPQSARAYLSQYDDLLVWSSLTDPHGKEIAL